MLRVSRRLGGFKRLQHHCRDLFTCSQLDNGLRVLTIDNGLTSSGIALLCNGGPALENADSAGASQVIHSLLLSGTERIAQPDLTHRLEPLGLQLRPLNFREAFGWALTAPGYSLSEALAVVNDACLSMTADPTLFAAAKERLGFIAEQSRRDMFRNTFDVLHQVTFNGVGLGRPELPTDEEIAALTLANTRAFHRRMVQPENAVLVISGVRHHDDAVRLVEERLMFESPPSGTTPKGPLSSSSQWKGGLGFVHNLEAPKTVTKFEEKNHCHVAIALKGPKLTDPDYIAAALAQTLLGGGASFSSGGPGKGLHSKLYQQVLWRNAWLNSIECVTAWYRASGFVALYATAEQAYTKQLITLVMEQAATIAGNINQGHLEMAKHQLLSQLIVLGEPREVIVEDCAKMLLLHNQLHTTEELLRLGESVNMEQFRRVCHDLVHKNDPVVVMVGDTTQTPWAKRATEDPASCLKDISEKLHTYNKRAKYL